MKRRHAPSDLAERLLAGPVVWIGLVLLTAFALGPFIWMLLTSLKNRQELYATPLQYLPVHPTFENYVDACATNITIILGRNKGRTAWRSGITAMRTLFRCSPPNA